jgi:deazaflavin-dependent oxidoreductase (nitroreductase family)
VHGIVPVGRPSWTDRLDKGRRMSEMNDWNTAVATEFRANGGVVGGPFAGATLLLLHTTGTKSGQARLNPLIYLPDGDRYVVFASYGGAPRHPDWYFNLMAQPQATIEVGTETIPVRAVEITGAERQRLWDGQVARSPQFREYAHKTTRVIPVVALERV